jgi:hypothetical protein
VAVPVTRPLAPVSVSAHTIQRTLRLNQQCNASFMFARPVAAGHNPRRSGILPEYPDPSRNSFLWVARRRRVSMSLTGDVARPSASGPGGGEEVDGRSPHILTME